MPNETNCQTDCNLSSVHSPPSQHFSQPPHIYISISDYRLSSSHPAESKYRTPLSRTEMHLLGPGGKGMNILPGAYLQCAAKCHMLQVHPLIARRSAYSTAWR